MSNQITIDGATTAIYEQNDRCIEIAGLPVANYDELTGGGTQREGRVHVFNAKGQIVSTTNGRAVPQNKTLKCLPETWNGIIRPALDALALSKGITGEDAYQKVEFTLVDQWVSQTIGARSYTERQSFKVNKDVPETPKDGNPFMHEIELFPTTLPSRKYS